MPSEELPATTTVVPDRWFLWTDFGGVLTPPVATQMAEFCACHAIDPAELRAALGRVAAEHGVADAMELLDRPILPEADWIAAVNRHLRAGRLPASLGEYWFHRRAANTGWIAVLHRVKAAGVGLGLLSNMVPAWDRHWRGMVDADALFDHVLLSFELGLRKPEPALFERAAELAGVPARRCILVDDLAENCAGARACGWQAVEFRDAVTADDAVRQILFSGAGPAPVTSDPEGKIHD